MKDIEMSTAPILILGATSGIGRAAMEEALSRGLPVRAFARSAGELAPAEGLEPVAGDATDAGDVARALDGAGAVIQALGVSGGVSMLWKTVTLFSQSTQVLLDEMPKAGVSRLVSVTGFGAGRCRPKMSAVERIGQDVVLGRPYADKNRQEEMITASTLDWTIARPVILTNGAKSGRLKVLREPAEWRNGLISRKDVALYLVDAVEKDLDIRGDVVLTR